MGVDMGGWIEYKDSNRNRYTSLPPAALFWHGIIKTNSLVGRDLDMFGMLFGISNYTNLAPVVGVRGLPPDISREAKESSKDWATFAQTWITWEEVEAISWDDEAVDGRPHCYLKEEDGTLRHLSKAAPHEGDVIEEGRTWEDDKGITWKVERISRREVFRTDREWHLVFDLMERLAKDYGDENVRLVAWFDR